MNRLILDNKHLIFLVCIVAVCILLFNTTQKQKKEALLKLKYETKINVSLQTLTPEQLGFSRDDFLSVEEKISLISSSARNTSLTIRKISPHKDGSIVCHIDNEALSKIFLWLDAIKTSSKTLTVLRFNGYSASEEFNGRGNFSVTFGEE